MSTPTPEQRTVLDNKARVRVVRAVPGSGKTWLVAALIKKELSEWHPARGGMAALSFTRVGGEEIRRTVGYDLHHSHFVGTLDAFLFRFIVRPFLKQVFPTLAVPRLIPAEWEPNKWQKGANNTNLNVPVGNGSSKQVFNLFNVCFLGEDQGKPVVACRQRDWDPILPLDAQASRTILKAKEELWKKQGWLTHSDAAFLGSNILGDKTHGPTVRTEVLRRFPLIIVDELQDTGWFLGKCILQLLAEPSVRGILVGDPDQAIYEFNGARPDLFDRFTACDGAEQLPLGRTQRCSSAVCKVAEHLAEPSRCIEPAPGRMGRAFLLSYNNLEEDVHKLRDWLATRSDRETVKMIARHAKTVERITGLAAKNSPKLGSVPLNHLHRAVNCFRQRRQVAALAAARATLEYPVFGHEGITQQELAGRGIDPTTWKRVCVDVLLEANSEVAGESFAAWGKRMVDFVHEQLASIVPAIGSVGGGKRIKLPAANTKVATRQDYLMVTASGSPQGSHITVQTVHAMKGETHDLTVFVCPDPTQDSRCPSVVWWSDDAANQEERRIAFVAVTRTRGDLIVCVSDQCLVRLKQNRASFVQSFECMSVDDFIAANKGQTSGQCLLPDIRRDSIGCI